MNTIYFITGANGVGKTTVMNEFKKMNEFSKFEIHDFDERGVPDKADATWRKSETQYWLSLTLSQTVPVIICGCVIPSEIIDSKLKNININIIFLEINDKELEKRIRSRYINQRDIDELQRSTGKNLDEFISDNKKFNEYIKNEAVFYGAYSIETSEKTPIDIAHVILNMVFSN